MTSVIILHSASISSSYKRNDWAEKSIIVWRSPVNIPWVMELNHLSSTKDKQKRKPTGMCFPVFWSTRKHLNSSWSWGWLSSTAPDKAKNASPLKLNSFQEHFLCTWKNLDIQMKFKSIQWKWGQFRWKWGQLELNWGQFNLKAKSVRMKNKVKSVNKDFTDRQNIWWASKDTLLSRLWPFVPSWYTHRAVTTGQIKKTMRPSVLPARLDPLVRAYIPCASDC